MKTSILQTRLLSAAGAFLFIFSVIFTLAPSVRIRTWDANYNWTHWIGFSAWAVLTILAQRAAARRVPTADTFLLPSAFLLTGWGLLTIFRLDSTFGLRQTVWLAISTATFILILHLPRDLNFFRRYKYLALFGGLLLTALTLLFGSNPAGIGPRLWLGGGAIYLQPSEPLKLLLVIYLCAYLSDRGLPLNPTAENRYAGRMLSRVPYLIPTFVMLGLSLLILLVQRDLGTASIFLVVYTLILYVATEKKRILIFTAFALILSTLFSYFFIDIVHARIEAWINPWADPSGGSYQIIQSLMAIANGGVLGRGPGVGSPGLVPVAISDFIFSAIAEETGLMGVIGLLLLIGILLTRGLRAALTSTSTFKRLLASGLTSYLAVQSLLILGGNLRLLPLTGVTLPFVSYGGSSLLTSFIALALLMRVSAHGEREPAARVSAVPYTFLATLFGLGLIACAFASGWWSIVRGPPLLGRTDNPRRSIADYYVRRGSLVDRDDRLITHTIGQVGFFSREYLYSGLGSVIGYTQFTFGQAGLEASLDGFLRGLRGNPLGLVQWHQLVYGTPPQGLDVRLSLDLRLHHLADETLSGAVGAIVLINAQSGEILVMASHPTYDPNQIANEGFSLLADPSSPLVNRAAQGLYAPASILDMLLGAAFENPSTASDSERLDFVERLGFYESPALLLPVAEPSPRGEMDTLRVSPLQVALAAAVFSADGIRPAPRIALAVNTLQEGWVVLPSESAPVTVMTPQQARLSVALLGEQQGLFWKFGTTVAEKENVITWFIAGTLPDWQGVPLIVVVLLEKSDVELAESLGLKLLNAALTGD